MRTAGDIGPGSGVRSSTRKRFVVRRRRTVPVVEAARWKVQAADRAMLDLPLVSQRLPLELTVKPVMPAYAKS